MSRTKLPNGQQVGKPWIRVRIKESYFWTTEPWYYKMDTLLSYNFSTITPYIFFFTLLADCIIFLLKNVSPSSTRISALNFLSLAMSTSGSISTSGKGKKSTQQGGKGITAASTSTMSAGEEGEIMLAQVLDAKCSPQGMALGLSWIHYLLILWIWQVFMYLIRGDCHMITGFFLDLMVIYLTW